MIEDERLILRVKKMHIQLVVRSFYVICIICKDGGFHRDGLIDFLSHVFSLLQFALK